MICQFAVAEKFKSASIQITLKIYQYCIDWIQNLAVAHFQLLIPSKFRKKKNQERNITFLPFNYSWTPVSRIAKEN